MKTAIKYISLLLLLITVSAKAQSNKIEKEYLNKLAESFISTDIQSKPGKIFWSLCLGEKTELDAQTLNKRIAALTSNEVERNAFYKRLNYYMSSTLTYYSQLLALAKVIPLTSEIEKELTEGKTMYVKIGTDKVSLDLFASADLKAYFTYVHAMKEDTALAGPPEPELDSNVNYNDMVVAEAPVASDEKVFTFVEQMPEYAGGDTEMLKFLQRNIIYPQMERDNDIQGRVILKFVVSKEGKVKDVSIQRTVSPNLDVEAKRVVKMFADFKPGRQQGKPVNVYFTLPIVFKLQ